MEIKTCSTHEDILRLIFRILQPLQNVIHRSAQEMALKVQTSDLVTIKTLHTAFR